MPPGMQSEPSGDALAVAGRLVVGWGRSATSLQGFASMC